MLVEVVDQVAAQDGTGGRRRRHGDAAQAQGQSHSVPGDDKAPPMRIRSCSQGIREPGWTGTVAPFNFSHPLTVGRPCQEGFPVTGIQAVPGPGGIAARL